MPTTIIRPDGEGTTQDWGLRSSYVYIDDATTQPTTPSGGWTDTCRTTGSNETNEFTLEDVPSPAAGYTRTMSNFRVWWIITGNPTGTGFQWSVKVNGSWQTLSTSNALSGWQYEDFAVTTTNRSGLELRCVSGYTYFGAWWDMDVAYVEVTYTDTGGGNVPAMYYYQSCLAQSF
tara:strand:+ start:6393 stop:6917 length:525 start_codon:yes stop_codon:yes gene_type:complete